MDEVPLRDPAEARYGLLRSTAIRWLETSLNLLFPPRCAGCGRVDTHWCDRCQRAIDAIPFPERDITLPPFNGCATTGVHEGKLQQAIHALKYENGRALAVPLGERLLTCLQEQGWAIDLIAPVPLHVRRQKTRGYNQAQLLGAYVAARMDVPFVPAALTRWRETTSQVGLSREQRHANVSGAFTADPTAVANRRLLLIDDVFTTGATLQACAQAALDADAAAAYSLTVTAARI